MRKTIVVGLVIAMIGIGVYLLIDRFGFNTKKLNKMATLENAGINSVYELQDEYVILDNDKIFKVNKESVQCMEITSSYSKNILWQENSYINQPIIVKNTNLICVFDKLGSNGLVYSKDGKLYEFKVNLPILEVSLSKEGGVAVLQKEEKKSVITVFDKNGNKVIERISYQENGGIPIASAIPDNMETFVASYIDVSNNNILSKVIFFKIQGKELKDNLFSSFEFDDTIVTNIKYISDEEVICVGDNKLIKINLFTNKYDEVKIDDQIKDVVFIGNDTIVLLCEKATNQLSGDNTLVNFYDKNLKKKKEQIIYNKIEQISNNKSTIVFGKNQDFYAYSKSGVGRWKNSFSTDIKQVLPFNNSDMILVVGNKEVDIYRSQAASLVANN